MPPASASSGSVPRVLHREWKAVKPHLPKSTSLPTFQLVPRDRPRFTCLLCGFVNFYNIPLCVWCATEGPESAVWDFERTMPRTRTASAPPRVFWFPNELCRRSSQAVDTRAITGDRTSTGSDGLYDIQKLPSFVELSSRRHEPEGIMPAVCFLSSDISMSGPADRRRQSMMAPLLHSPSGRQQAHKRSHSQPNALRIGHSSRPYYSAIRKDTSSYLHSDARPPRASRLSSLPLPPPATFQADDFRLPISISDEEDETIPRGTFAFVSPVAGHPDSDEARTPHRTLSARISHTLASPVSALHSMSREAEMRAALAAIVQEAQGQGHEESVVTARLRKLRRGLRVLVRRASTN
ncbi:hypothetical protein C8R43DRAFT_1233004 [Mycena crocata]|nr:hypothetical protein C8R43DRAFT_1233004 [Mycena crocata]